MSLTLTRQPIPAAGPGRMLVVALLPLVAFMAMAHTTIVGETAASMTPQVVPVRPPVSAHPRSTGWPTPTGRAPSAPRPRRATRPTRTEPRSRPHTRRPPSVRSASPASRSEGTRPGVPGPRGVLTPGSIDCIADMSREVRLDRSVPGACGKERRPSTSFEALGSGGPADSGGRR